MKRVQEQRDAGEEVDEHGRPMIAAGLPKGYELKRSRQHLKVCHITLARIFVDTLCP